MKKKLLKRIATVAMVAVMALGTLVGCSGPSNGGSAGGSKGTIMWLSNLSSGPQFEAAKAYGEAICAANGYKFTIVYGDPYNDPNGNLTAVKNAMTSDVVGLVTSQDGGVNNIMDEYPELYVVGYNTDMNAIYGEGGPATALQQSDHFLGTICDGYYDGTLLGQQMADAVIEQGYEKVATMSFPSFAYPNLAAADAGFRAAIKEHNKTADKKIKIVGESKVLEFSPLEESYFLEDGHDDLDAIIGFCAGVDFIYPAMKSAMSNGTCSKDTKLITGGLNTEESIIADMGEGKVISFVTISPIENLGWSLTLLDKAISGEMYDDYTANERINSIEYVIDSSEDAQNVVSKSIIADVKYAQITVEELAAITSYADLKELYMSEQLSVEALGK